jgi:hypothetical protein
MIQKRLEDVEKICGALQLLSERRYCPTGDIPEVHEGTRVVSLLEAYRELRRRIPSTNNRSILEQDADLRSLPGRAPASEEKEELCRRSGDASAEGPQRRQEHIP